jgi:hypothetical protein
MIFSIPIADLTTHELDIVNTKLIKHGLIQCNEKDLHDNSIILSGTIFTYRNSPAINRIITFNKLDEALLLLSIDPTGEILAESLGVQQCKLA